MGCQKWLGLAHPSQYDHKTVWYAIKVTGQEEHGIFGTTPKEAPNVQLSVKMRAYQEYRHLQKARQERIKV